VLTFAIITYMHVVFGEQMPKILALEATEKVGLWVAVPLNLFSRFTGPLAGWMNSSSVWFLRRLGYKGNVSDGEVHTVDELRLLVEDTEEAGLLDPEQAIMLMNVFGLSDKKVADIMILRDKMNALDVNSPPDKVMETVRMGAHTRMPVFDGTLDNIVGIVNTKDLFFLFSTQGLVVLEDAMYPAKFLPPDAPVRDAFRLFRKTHHPIALVRNSENVVLGLLTLEDVLEEIVGDIEDEHDVPVPKLKLKRKWPAGVPTVRPLNLPRPSTVNPKGQGPGEKSQGPRTGGEIPRAKDQ
jgi:putative hemolysin